MLSPIDIYVFALFAERFERACKALGEVQKVQQFHRVVLVQVVSDELVLVV